MADAEQTEDGDGRVELAAGVTLSDARLFNADLAPTTLAQRTWTTYAFAALWVSLAHCIPTYMMAAGLIKLGMSWWQAIVTILVGNSIVLVPILLNSHPGTKYGIPFPVFARAAYGVFGANLPALMRAIVACGWFGIQCWIGGHALDRFVEAFWSGWPMALGAGKVGGYLPTQWLCYAVFWSLNIVIVYRGMDLLRRVESWAAPYVLLMTTLLLVWILRRASAAGGASAGIGSIVAATGKFATPGEFLGVFVPSVTAMVGFWATLSLNMPDFTRYGRSQREQVIGQAVALPTTMTVFAAMGVFITSASAIVFGEAIWDPIDLGARMDSRALVALAELTAAFATLAMNIAANVVSPANDFSNLAPGKISFRAGGLITGVLATLMMPWKLLENSDRYINGWLLGYSGGLGSIAGVLICDYWFIRRTHLVLADLYRRDGAYAYGSRLGTNRAAVVATAAGCVMAWIGLFVPALHWLYDASWFSGTLTSALVYGVWMRGQARLPDAPRGRPASLR
jgi:nucleobase:cation symporter-1, NCS1 family